MMRIVVLANDSLKEELLVQGLQDNVQVEWINAISQIINYPDADAYMDLLFDNDPVRIGLLGSITMQPVIINYVAGTLNGLPSNFVRINGWNSFLKRSVVEASCPEAETAAKAEKIFALFSKKTEWTPDLPGFISARVVAMIINEAYFTLAEGVSSPEEIDTAMKSGTNYPYGPFEWSKKIGADKILELLTVLSTYKERYEPAALLKKETVA
jgi:3-hydroxybutyryl-CoA dehydrogenase